MRHKNKEKNRFAYKHILQDKVYLHQQKKKNNLHRNKNSEILDKLCSTLLHGSECWTVTKDVERRLEAAAMWYIKRIMSISWTGGKSN